ncbi:hypothetical protein V5F79_00200 [Xanthobacter flavus]
MNEDDFNFNTDALAALFQRAADLSRKPIEFDNTEVTDDTTEN